MLNKRSQYTKVALFGSVSLLLLVPTTTAALVFRSGDQVNIPSNEVILEDLYAAGGIVTTGSPINGDLLAAGGTILVSGPVSGDVALSGGSVTVMDAVGDDVRGAGGTILINGSVGGDVLIGGGQVSLNGPLVGGDVVIGGGSVSINSPVRGDVRVGGGEVRINAPITGSVNIMADKIIIGSSAVISGNLTYSSPKEATIESGARVLGKTDYTQTKVKSISKGKIIAFFSITFLIKFFSFLLCALVLGLFFKRYSLKITEQSLASPLLEFGRGLVTTIVLPAASALLLATVIGFPLGVLGFLGFISLLIVGGILSPIVIGSFIYKKITKSPAYEISWKTILIGVSALFLLALIPFIGWLIIMISMLVAIGSAVKLKWDIAKEWR